MKYSLKIISFAIAVFRNPPPPPFGPLDNPSLNGARDTHLSLSTTIAMTDFARKEKKGQTDKDGNKEKMQCKK